MKSGEKIGRKENYQGKQNKTSNKKQGKKEKGWKVKSQAPK